MEMSSQLHDPATLASGKEPPEIGGGVGSRAGLDMMAKRKFLPLLGIEPQSSNL
jgi:hypothetical protein